MSKRDQSMGMDFGFHMPYLAGAQYAPGIQPNSPGESVAPNAGALFNLLGWPTAVGVLNTQIGNVGIARARAGVAVNNRYADLPENWLFIAGFVGKSQG